MVELIFVFISATGFFFYHWQEPEYMSTAHDDSGVRDGDIHIGMRLNHAGRLKCSNKDAIGQLETW